MVVDEGGKSAVAIAGTMNGCLNGGLQSIVAAIAIQAGVPGKFFRMVPQAELVVGLVEVSHRQNQLALAIALETATWHYIKNAIRAVSLAGSVAPSIHLEIIDILGIDLRSDVARDIGIGDIHPVDHPAQLVSSAHVQHVMGHI